MSTTPVYQQKDTVYAFSVYDESHDLAYSKYTFKFDLYRSDHASDLPESSTQSEIFYHFLIKNDTDLNKPFSIKPELVTYFNPMTPEVAYYHDKYGYGASINYMQSVYYPGAISFDVIYENQFELIEYSYENIRRLQDYIYYEDNDDDPDFDLYYTKYNFDFDSYKRDWNVFSIKKMPVFTDFVFRTQYLNKSVIGAYGYGKPTDAFKKYFLQNDPNLQEYLLKYSVTSIYSRVSNSYPNIDWDQYKANNSDLSYTIVSDLQDHFIQYGQFEQRVIPFISRADPVIAEKTRSIVSISSDSGEGSGFLYNGSAYNILDGKKQVYLVTCYHIIASSQNKNAIKIRVNYFDSLQNKQVAKKLAFRIIGYDIFYDVLVGLYDPTLDYNIQFNSELNVDSIPTIDIDGISNPQKNEDVYVIGNIGKIDTNVVIQGKLMNNKYRGDYENSFVLGMPDSYLINFYSEPGLSGSPVFQDNNDNCIGMIIGVVGEKSQYTIALSGYYLSALAFNALKKWYTFLEVFPVYNINTLNFFIKDIFQKKWLGVICKYYSSDAKSIWPALNNYNYDSGLLVEDFIIGVNKTTVEWITNTLDLDQYNVQPLNTPLLNTKMYQRFIINNRVPIIIKSMYCFEAVESDFDNFTFGLKNNQYGFNKFTHELGQIESLRTDPKYITVLNRVYPQVSITYYYYNGNIWVEDTEVIGGNTPDWYNEYKTDSNQLLIQHKFEYPQTLIPYSTSYISCIGDVCTATRPQPITMTTVWYCVVCPQVWKKKQPNVKAYRLWNYYEGEYQYPICWNCGTNQRTAWNPKYIDDVPYPAPEGYLPIYY